MAKGPSPLLGYNTNVRHKGRVFHIQTEDSGVAHPHVITHLFADGGRIIKTNKTPYKDLLEQQGWADQVRKIMQDQHKAMFVALRDGQFDYLIDPGSVPQPAATPEEAPKPADPPKAAEAPKPPEPAKPLPATPPGPKSSASTYGMPAVRPSAPGAPPGPKVSPSVAAIPAARPAAANPPGPAPAPAADPGVRYAAVRPADSTTAFKAPSLAGGSIFGDSFMSEKSLDEVILAYLAEDLEDGKR